MTTYPVALSYLETWYPGLPAILIPVNQALRNINRGKMDYLPYSQATPGFSWYMEALLTPQGESKPPAIGHWQLRLSSPDGAEIVLQGKSQEREERGMVIFRCPSPEREKALASANILPE